MIYLKDGVFKLPNGDSFDIAIQKLTQLEKDSLAKKAKAENLFYEASVAKNSAITKRTKLAAQEMLTKADSMLFAADCELKELREEIIQLTQLSAMFEIIAEYQQDMLRKPPSEAIVIKNVKLVYSHSRENATKNKPNTE